MAAYGYSDSIPDGLPDDTAEEWMLRAARLIDRLTLGRAARYEAEEQEALADACGQIALLLCYRSAAREQSRGGLLASASNDGYSESYASGSGQSGSAAAQAREILADCLGADEHGLLYRGVGLCC